ncbi:hypothetical protein HOI04_01485, partial [archaeon]|nr:hypothetical protein [archaeon]
MVNETVRKIPIRSRKKVLDKRKSLSTRKKKKLRRKLLSTRPREEISIGNVGLATTKLLGKKTFKKSKKKPLGTLEETIAGESKEDFWKSHVELDEDREDSEEGFYSPSKRDEEDDPNIFYGPSNNESKYEAGQDSIDSRPSSNVEVIRPGLALKSSEKDSFDPSGNFIQGSK